MDSGHFLNLAAILFFPQLLIIAQVLHGRQLHLQQERQDHYILRFFFPFYFKFRTLFPTQSTEKFSHVM